MAVFIGAVKKKFKNKSELLAEIKRLYTLAWISESKIKYEDATGRILNPHQDAAVSRALRRARKLGEANDISNVEMNAIANLTYRQLKKK